MFGAGANEKHDFEAEVKGQQVTLTFPEGVDVAHLFPEGSYKLLVAKGAITRAELKQDRSGADE